MSTPSTLTISLPPRFGNSYWTSPDYRIGVQELYRRLQQGIDQNAGILAIIQHRTEAEYRYAEQLATPTPSPALEAPLFKEAVDHERKGARLLSSLDSAESFVFRTIEEQTSQVQASAHGKVARAIERSILVPFGAWCNEHRDRLKASWEELDTALYNHERLRADVERMRQSYETKCQNADEAEDDARFVGQQQDATSSSSSSTATVDGADIEKASTRSTESSLPVSPSSNDKELIKAKPEKLDPDRLQRRETLRAQFGFRRSAGGHGEADSKDEAPTQRRSSAEAEKQGSQSKATTASPGSDSLRRAGTISHALTSAISKASSLRAALVNLDEPRHLRLRKEAEIAEHTYRDLVRQLDRVRCALEDTLAEHFVLAERWEGNRLNAVSRVLASLTSAFTPLLPEMNASFRQIASLQPRLHPDVALSHMIGRSRLGQYTPRAEIFQPYYHDDASSLSGAGTASFGMDLVAFVRAETLISENVDGVVDGVRAGSGSNGKGMPPLPLALAALLGSLERRYSDDTAWTRGGPAAEGQETQAYNANEEKRKAWIYEVPLSSVHLCRESIISHLLGNSVPGADVGAGLNDKLARFDAPTLAATVKIWALELADSLIPMRLWDSVVSTYQAAADQERDAARTSKAANNSVVDAEKPRDLSSDEPLNSKVEQTAAQGLDPVLAETIKKGVMSDLGVILSRLPKIHLVCLDGVIGHLSRLIKATQTGEDDALFINKVALSLSRALVRPSRETPGTMRSVSPVLLAYDLITYYDDLLPKALEAKAKDGEHLREFQRQMPIRKRTKPVDQRISRSSMAGRSRTSALSSATLTEEPDEVDSAPKPAYTPRIKTGSGSSAKQVSADTDSDHNVTPTATRAPSDPVKEGSAGQVNEAATGIPAVPDTASLRAPALERGSSAASSKSDASAYDTPDEDGESKAKKSAAASSTKSPPSENLDDDKPLTSNVARLSRQFGRLGSSGSAAPSASTTPTRSTPGTGSGSASSINRTSRVRGPRAP